jgi:indole-3-pyruvate monooxygenase
MMLPCSYKAYAINTMQNGESFLNEEGMPKRDFPNHWKGENGIYCIGLAMRGLTGVSFDAKMVAGDIKSTIDSMHGAVLNIFLGITVPV